jgi:hypothetical protein
MKAPLWRGFHPFDPCFGLAAASNCWSKTARVLTMKIAEKALLKRTNKMLASATKRYKKLMRQAAKAASEHKREQYLAAALTALIATGVVASKLKANLKRKRKAKTT